MTVLDIVSYAVAGILAVTRVLEATKPYWKFVPAKVAAFLPSLVAMLPVLAAQVGLAHTGLDLVNALLVSGALLLPGAGVSTDAATKA